MKKKITRVSAHGGTERQRLAGLETTKQCGECRIDTQKKNEGITKGVAMAQREMESERIWYGEQLKCT